VNGDSLTVKTLGDGVHNGSPHSTPHTEGTSLFDEFRWLAQRTGDTCDELSGLHGNQIPGALSNGLNDQGDGSLFGIGIRDGQGYALGTLRAVYNDELSGLAYLCKARGLYVQPGYIRAQALLGDDLMHGYLYWLKPDKRDQWMKYRSEAT
jgi:hypothetical protein